MTPEEIAAEIAAIAEHARVNPRRCPAPTWEPPDPAPVVEAVTSCRASCEAMQARNRGMGRAEYLRSLEAERERKERIAAVKSAAARADRAEGRIAAGLAALAEAEAVARTGTRPEVAAAIGKVGKELRGGSDK